MPTPKRSETSTRPGKKSRAAWLPAGLLLLTFAVLDAIPLAAADVSDVRDVLLPDDKRAPLAPSEQEKLRWQPLSAKLLNAVLVARSGEGFLGGPTEGWSVLERLGYRSNEAQVDLMLRAAARNDPHKVLLHADALMRRDKRPRDIWPSIAQIEKTDPTGNEVYAYLKEDPSWRANYLAKGALIDHALLPKRRALLERLSGDGLVGRRELATTMLVAADQQRADEIGKLAQLSRKLGFDDGSRRFEFDDQADVVPTRWTFPQSREVQSFTAGDNKSVGFDYTPPGGQILAERILLASDAGRLLAFEIKSEGASPPLLSINVVCPGKRVTLASAAEKRLSAKLPETFPCAVPRVDLRVLGATAATRFEVRAGDET